MPGVYRPQSDTDLLRAAFHDANLPPGGSVLDIGTGTGVMAITAARAGAATVTAVDITLRAVLAARLNARLHRARVTVHHGDALTVAAGNRYDIILANPPYVPTLDDSTPSGPTYPWHGGTDGRTHIDRICAAAHDLLDPGGTLLMVHSTLCDPDLTVTTLRAEGLKAAVVARTRTPFGPVMRARARSFIAAGLISETDSDEELVVVRADLPVMSSVEALEQRAGSG